jgi:hypothetical protein
LVPGTTTHSYAETKSSLIGVALSEEAPELLSQLGFLTQSRTIRSKTSKWSWDETPELLLVSSIEAIDGQANASTWRR